MNTTTASTAGLVEEKAVKDLPLNGRSYDRLITLNPGTSSVTTNLRPTAANVSQGYLFNVNGGRSNDNLFMVNGIEFTGASRIGAMPGGASGQLLGVEAVREFNVESSTYGIDGKGKRNGGQVHTITQSGTNQFHGTAFEFLGATTSSMQRTFLLTRLAQRSRPFEETILGRRQEGRSEGQNLHFWHLRSISADVDADECSHCAGCHFAAGGNTGDSSLFGNVSACERAGAGWRTCGKL